MAMHGKTCADKTRVSTKLRWRECDIAQMRRQMALKNGQDQRRKRVNPFGDASRYDHRPAAKQRDSARDCRTKRSARLIQRL